jgi:O-antigen/teichoic acid export membrane protein
LRILIFFWDFNWSFGPRGTQTGDRRRGGKTRVKKKSRRETVEMRVLLAFSVNVLFNFVVGLLVAKFLGPEEYGRFALALATAMAVQILFFDWLRLGATRFYSERVRGEEPALRATLDVGFALLTFGLAAASALLLLSGPRFSLSNGLIGLAMAAAVSNGLFDYHTALVRARFHDRLYTRLIIVKNFMALCLTGGGAFVFGSAQMALVGGVISLTGSIVLARASLADPGAEPALARPRVASALLRYCLPIVCANLLYLAIPLANRSIVAVLYGFSETGQFSLAFDIGTKAIQAIGSALDVLLFQIAVAAHERDGVSSAKAQIGQNMAIVLAIILPACTGIWLTLPSIQLLIVPVAFRGPFGDYLTLMMGGLFCSAIIQYGINPIFQIAKKTAPLIAAALVACAVDPLLLLVLPHAADASMLAVAQSGAYASALIVLIIFAAYSKPQWPRLYDIWATVLGTIAMAAALLPLRAAEPGLLTLVEQIAAGVIIYAFCVFTLDTAGLRRVLIARLGPVAARFRTS